MRILIADDDSVSLLSLESMLRKRGHDVITAEDGDLAWEILQKEDAPPLAILDWLMPGLDGPDVCRKARALPQMRPGYLILLTSRGSRDHLIEGLQAGADDYVTKPFDPKELEARINVGIRVVGLQEQLKDRVIELESALTSVRQLQGLLPICCYCNRIRDDQNYWQKIESYISGHSQAQFSHGICPECLDTVLKPSEIARLKAIPSSLV